MVIIRYIKSILLYTYKIYFILISSSVSPCLYYKAMWIELVFSTEL